MLKKVLMAGVLCAMGFVALLPVANAQLPYVYSAAGVLGLNNTGVEAQGSTDTNYTFSNSLGFSGFTNFTNPYVTELVNGSGNTIFPGNAWLPDNNTSKWISPQANYSPAGYDPSGFYLFQTTFNNPNFSNSYNITGNWATDNLGVGIYLNGQLVSGTSMLPASYNNQSLAPTNDSLPSSSDIQSWFDSLTSSQQLNYFQTPTSFSIPSTTGFIKGGNTLDFLVYNAIGSSYNPAGLNVNFAVTSNSALPVPEPIFFQLGTLLLCAGGLALFRRAHAGKGVPA